MESIIKISDSSNGDSISRQAVLNKILKFSVTDGKNCVVTGLWTEVNQLPSVTPMVDCVEREKLLKIYEDRFLELQKLKHLKENKGEEDRQLGVNYCINILKEMPPATLSPKTGEKSEICHATELLHRVIERKGKDHQIDIAIEEMSELTKALLKDRRHHSPETVNDITEEMADVYICLAQLSIIYKNRSGVEDMIDKKLQRLAKRLKELKQLREQKEIKEP